MQLQDFVSADLVAIDVAASDKQQLLTQLVELLLESGRVRDRDALMRELVKRELVMSTGIGGGIAIPHALTNDIESLTVVFARTAAPIDFQALDSQPVDLVFMLVGPKSAASLYVKLLARVSRLLQNEAFKERLRGAAQVEEVMDAFRAESEFGG